VGSNTDSSHDGGVHIAVINDAGTGRGTLTCQIREAS